MSPRPRLNVELPTAKFAGKILEMFCRPFPYRGEGTECRTSRHAKWSGFDQPSAAGEARRGNDTLRQPLAEEVA